ncbi:IS110 family transposase [Pseudoruegeria sp. SK021]|uniref:IS110 family transposase n=1 Tax=Pseudoruegeria sp. SK021 TaxID=1933035 RepID=UPI000A25D1ED|nr:IS110 family transposase [Pseudoruegeria sp. SK021]OSP53862.1 IS110 family transposase [Pseudoruegeria sp. SK021]
MDQIIIGVDTHKSKHIAVAISRQGARLGTMTLPTTRQGYRDLEVWASELGTSKAFGIEGTGAYGAGLSRDLLAKGYTVLDVMRPNRQLRYLHGKSDSLDAESAARSVLNGQATALAKTQAGASEMIRHLKIARDSAVKARSQAIITLKTLIINAPAELREMLELIKGPIKLIRHIAALRPGKIVSPTASAKAAMRAIARRWLLLHEEIHAHDQELEPMVREKAPGLMNTYGVGVMTAAEMLIVVGDNPERIKSEAALAKLCGVCPIPASSGKTNRMRLNRGGNRQANAALYIVAITRMRDHEVTQNYVLKRTAQGKSKREITRCLKRYIIREIYRELCAPNDAKCAP